MRWFVDISSIGSGGGKASRFCVEAEQWQRALQSVRALRGDTSPFANFSIELLEDGYRAIDPATRSRYVVQKAPDDAETSTKPMEVPVQPSVPPPAPSRPRSQLRAESRSETGEPVRARTVERTRRGRLSIPDDPVPRQTAGPTEALKLTPPPAASPATPVPQPAAQPESPPEPESPPRTASPRKPEPDSNAAVAAAAPRSSAPPAPSSQRSPASQAQVRASSAPPPSSRVPNATTNSAPPAALVPAPDPTRPVARPMQAETAFERMTAGFASFPVAAQPTGAQSVDGSTSANIDVKTEILPRFRILSERSDSPTASSPLSYREMVFGVSESTSFADAEAIVRSQFEVVKASLRQAPKGQFITLAVFDHEFDGKPRRLPLATLSFKDWRDPEPVVRFPLREARNSTQASPSNAPPPPSGLPRAAQMAQTMLVPTVVSIDARRSDAALPKVDPSADAPDTQRTDSSRPPPPSKRNPPPPTPSQIRRAAVAMGAEELTDVIKDAHPRVETRVIPDPPESLTQVMPAPAKTAASDDALSEAPTPAIEPGRTYPVGSATDRGVFPAVTLPSGVEPFHSKSSPPPAQPRADGFGVTAPAEPLSSAMRSGASESPVQAPAPTGGTSTPPSTPPQAQAFPVVDQSTRAASPPPPQSHPPAQSVAPQSHPPSQSVAPQGYAPQSKAVESKARVRGDELISELFEALSDLAFLSDPLEGADFVLGVALENLPSELGFVSFFSLDSREFVVVRASERAAPGLVMKRAGERASLAAKAMRAHQAVVLSEGAAEAVVDDPRWQASGVSPRTLICAPVKLGGRYLGLIELANPTDGVPYTAGDGHAIEYIAQQFAEFLAQREVVLDPERITAPKLSARLRK